MVSERQALSEAGGLSGEALNQRVAHLKDLPALKQSLVVSSSKLSKVNQVTQQRVTNGLRVGLEKGEDLEQLTARVQKTLKANRARAGTIARTHTAGAISSGRHEGHKQSNVKGKVWITAGDDHVRESHQAAGKTYAKAIPLSQPFVVGGAQLMYPTDPSGPAGEIINCRCLEIARALAEKMLSMNYTFYSYADMIRDRAA